MQKTAWFGMTLLAAGIAGYALLNVVWVEFRPPFVANIFSNAPIAAYLHMGFGLLAMATGPFQFLPQLRQKALHLHRWLGRLYVASVLISGVAGFVLAWQSFGGLVTHVGFAMMAVAWLLTTALALKSVLQGNVYSHRIWMLRSYALTLAGVTLRIYLGLSFAIGIPFNEFYPVLSWICWVPNIMVVDWLMLSQKRKKQN